MNRKLRDQRKAQGYCTTCYLRIPERFGYKTCDACLLKKVGTLNDGLTFTEAVDTAMQALSAAEADGVELDRDNTTIIVVDSLRKF